jgi:transposase-like protein
VWVREQVQGWLQDLLEDEVTDTLGRQKSARRAAPKAHWIHLRTTNVVESPFAAVRLRTSEAKRFKKVESAEALIWKLLMLAERTFRRLNAPRLMQEVNAGTPFVDGVAVKAQPASRRLAA